jgi:hypothetical protein
MKIKVKQVVTYGGHSISANGAVNLTLKAQYSELVNTINVMPMLNNDVNIQAKFPQMGAMKLGSFRVKQLIIDDDGESTLKFNGITEYVEVDELNKLAMNDGKTNAFTVLMSAEIESEIDEYEKEVEE